MRERIREAIAAVLGTTADFVALTDSTTRGCQIVVNGLGLSAEDEIVTTDQEHFGLIGPLHASGARVVVAEADEEALLAAVTPRTRLIATSHVLWTTGRRLDLARLRQPNGPQLLVDGAQSAGAIPVDLSGADYYTVSAQKWLCSVDQSGALFVRDPERLRVALPSMYAQLSHEVDGSFVPEGRRSAVRRRLDGRTAARGPRSGAGRASGVAVRRRSRCGRPLQGAARALRGGGDACGSVDAGFVPPARESDGAGGDPGRARSDRARDSRSQSRPRRVRLVDERRRPAEARGRTSRVGRARPRSAAAPRPPCGCGRRGRRRAPRRPCRRLPGARRPRRTAA